MVKKWQPAGGGAYFSESASTEKAVQWEHILLNEESDLESFMSQQTLAETIGSSGVAMDLIYHIDQR